MIPAGYIFKKVAAKPDWLKSDLVLDIFSVSNCTSADFVDFTRFWKHNGYWLFNSPRIAEEIAASDVVDLSECTLFYYEVYEREFDDESKEWSTFAPEASLPTEVEVPAKKCLRGYDVVTFSTGNTPGCSPLSCNSLAEKIVVNKHCLFNSVAEAKAALEAGGFQGSEPGPFRIFAVFTLDMASSE